MFCSECGAKAGGKFCSHCGKLLVNAADEEREPAVDWGSLTDYEALVRVPEVRDRIARHAARSKKKLTAEEFLETCDKVLTPLTGGVPMTFIANIAQPLSARLGLKSGQTRVERFAHRPGAVIVAILCSLAEHNCKLGDVTQTESGCTLKAAVPSDIWAFKGDLVVDVRVEGAVTVVEAGVTIPGQWYDWGKSRRRLEQLFADVALLAKAA